MILGAGLRGGGADDGPRPRSPSARAIDLADSARCAGHQRDLALEIHHAFSTTVRPAQPRTIAERRALQSAAVRLTSGASTFPGPAFENLSHTSCRHPLTHSTQTHRMIGLSHQRFFDPETFGMALLIDIVDDRDPRSIHRDSVERFPEPCRNRSHQRGVEWSAHRQCDSAFRAASLCGPIARCTASGVRQ